MDKVIELKFNGNLNNGFQVNLTIANEGESRQLELSGNLPPAPDLQKIYSLWQSNYRSIDSISRITVNQVTYNNSTKDYTNLCLKYLTQLKEELNKWLNSPGFQSLSQKILEKVDRHLRVRFLIRTTNEELQRIPWPLWNLLAKYPNAEISIAAKDFEKIVTEVSSTQQKKISILAILGNNQNINIQTDRELLEDRLTFVYIKFLEQPKLEAIYKQLSSQKWDILFFAGHSRTNNGVGEIDINQNESITLEQLSGAL